MSVCTYRLIVSEGIEIRGMKSKFLHRTVESFKLQLHSELSSQDAVAKMKSWLLSIRADKIMQKKHL